MGGIFGKIDRQNTDGLVASYNISQLIAKSDKPQTIGEKLILPAMQEAVTSVMHSDVRSVIQSIPLSNDTVARRINLMASDVEKTLCSILKQRNFLLKLTNPHCQVTKLCSLLMSAFFQEKEIPYMI